MNNIISRLSEKQRLIVVLIAGFVAGVALTTLFFVLPEGAPVSVSKVNNTQAVQERQVGTSAVLENIVSDGAEKVIVQDQSAGSVVRLSSVTLSSSSWVAVHENMAGMPGNVLGAVRLDQGMSAGQVALLRPTESGVSYYVRVYRDDGDRMFDLTKDAMVINVANVPIGDTFQTNN